MIRKPLSHDLAPEGPITRAKWVRGVTIFYGCAALLLFGVIATRSPSAVKPHGSTNLDGAPANSPGPRSAAGDHNADAPTASISPPASDQTAAPQAPRGPSNGHCATADIRAALTDPAIRDFVGLAENAFDFNRPDSIPGFGPMRPFDNIDELVAQATGRPADRTSEARVEPGAATKRAQ